MLLEVKKLTIPSRNCMKTKQEPEKAIPETQEKYKDIIFGFDSRICGGCLKEPQEQIDDDRIYQERLKE